MLWKMRLVLVLCRKAQNSTSSSAMSWGPEWLAERSSSQFILCWLSWRERQHRENISLTSSSAMRCSGWGPEWSPFPAERNSSSFFLCLLSGSKIQHRQNTSLLATEGRVHGLGDWGPLLLLLWPLFSSAWCKLTAGQGAQWG